MNDLPPLAIVGIGSVLLGIAMAVGTWISLPDARHGSALVRMFLIATAVGLTFFAPIAAIAAAKARHPDWILRHAFRIGWHTSMAMAIATGYFIASIRHDKFEAGTFAAMVVLIMGSALKIGLSSALQGMGASSGQQDEGNRR